MTVEGAPAAAPASAPLLTDDDLSDLPAAVQRYLRAMGVPGRPPVDAFEARFVGRLRLRPGQRWMPLRAKQRNTVEPTSRRFDLRVRLLGMVPMSGRDTYVDGAGRIRGRVAGLVPVADGSGPEFDVGELATWLDDAVLLAPSMLLRHPGVSWADVAHDRFQVTVHDHGHTASAQVLLDDDARPRDVETTDRWCALPDGLVRARWRTPVTAWGQHDGRPVPTSARAVWDLPSGPFTYVEGGWVPASLDFDPAGSPAPPTAVQVVAAISGAAQLAVTLAGAPVLRHRYNRWGATAEEVGSAMPGDELVADARLTSTRAITVGAPPAVVWAWLVQIGHGRGGLYSFDVLEDLVGCDLHSAEALVGEWQELCPGDEVRLGPPGYPAYEAVEVEAPRVLVLRGGDGGATTTTWAWRLSPVAGGCSTRLVARQRLGFPPRAAVLWHVVEPVGFVMEREMLRGIRRRAERSPDATGPMVARQGTPTAG